MPSAALLVLHPDDNDPGHVYKNREFRVNQIQVNTSDFMSSLYPKSVFDDEVLVDPNFC